MKTVYIFIAVLFLAITNLSAQVIWDDFESNRIGNYGFINGVFVPYVANDVAGGTNSSAVAASYTRDPGATFDVIIIDADMADLAAYKAGTKQMTLDVYSPAVGKTVQITLENKTTALPANYPTGRYAEFTAVTTVANQWETLTFNFVNAPDPSVGDNDVDRLVLLFDPNTQNNDVYRFDNLMGPELDTDPCAGVTPNASIFNDFECNQNVNFTFSHSASGFRRVENPSATGVNTSSYVATYSRNAGEEFDVIVGSFDVTLPAPPANYVISLDVLDSIGFTPIRLVLQNAAGDDLDSIDVTTGVNNGWATMNFPVTTTSPDISNFVILFNPGTFTSDKFYFDNFRGGVASGISEVKAVEDLSVYPNPTSGLVSLNYSIAKSSEVEILVKDITGKNVAIIANEFQTTGNHTSVWNASDMSNGIYFYTIRTNKGIESGKIVVNK